MSFTFNPSTLQTIPTTIVSSFLTRNQKRQNRRWNPNKQNQKQIHVQDTKTKPAFSRPSPTPLLVHENPSPQTKLQALSAVIDQVEASVKKGIAIDAQIFSSLLETCFHLRAVDHGFRIHRLVPGNLLRRNVGISSKLLRLYASGGHVDEAHQVFDKMPKRNESAFVWNSLISGYAESGLYEDALAIYFQMDEEGVEPDNFTFPRALKACSGIGSIRIGEEIHRQIVRRGFWNDGYIHNSLIDMYAKCGDIIRARKVFNKMAIRDIVSFNSMITAYIHHGLMLEALDTFCLMMRNGYVPDSIAVSAILADVPSIKVGSQIHGWVLRWGMEHEVSIANALVIFYSEHDKFEQARRVFDEMSERDVVSWNSIISAHSKDPKALMYFAKMESSSLLPDRVTFVSLLSACAHLALVEEGERLFLSMRQKYGIKPVMEHYACMVNMYGRAGLINEAYGLVVDGMEIEAGPTVWGALLYACFVHGNVAIGEAAAQNLFELEPDNEHNFELLMKIYGNEGRFDDAERVRLMMVERGLGS